MNVSTNEVLSKLLFQEASEALLIVDTQLVIVQANDAFLSLFNISKKEIVGRLLSKTLDFANVKNLPSILENHFLSGSMEIKFENACTDVASGYYYDVLVVKLENIPTSNIIFKLVPTAKTLLEKAMDYQINLQKQSEALLAIAKKPFLQNGDLEECFKILTATAAQILNISSCSIWLFEAEDLVCKMIYDKKSNSYSEGIKLKANKYANYFKTIRNTGMIDASDAQQDPRTVEFVEDYFIPNKVVSVLDIAINNAGKLYGVLCCEQVGNLKNWRLDEKNFANYICETISHTISIHEELKIKKEILKREKYFQSLIENSLDVIAIANSIARFTYFSPSITRVLGYELTELIGCIAYEFVHPEDHEILMQQYDFITAHPGKSTSFRIRYLHKNGTWRHVEAIATNLLEVEGLNGIVINFRDISEKILADKEILKKEKYFRMLTENSFDVRYTADKEGYITYISPSVQEILGFTPEELVGKNGWRFVADTHKELVSREWERICNTSKGEMNVQFPILKKDGSAIEAELVAKNMLDDLDIKGVIVTFRDITERKIFEKKILESEEYFRSLIENSNDGITIIDEFGKRIYVSPSNEKLFGYNLEEMMGKSPFDLGHPDEVEQTNKEFLELFKHPNMVSTLEKRVRHATKTEWMTLEITAKNLLHNPVVKGIVLNARDITERIKIQQKLKDSEEYFRALIENSSDVISVVDEFGMRKFTSLSVKTVFGRNPEDIMGTSPMEIIHPDDLQNIKTLLKKMIENPGIALRTETRMSNANGDWLHLDAVGRNLLHNPAVRGIVLNARDITETKVVQQKLALSEKYYRSLIENSNDMISICDAEANFVYASPSVQRFLGYPDSEYLSSNLLSFIHEDFIKACKKVLAKSIEHAGVTFKQELYHKHKDGHFVYLETIFNNLINDEAVHGIVMISRDISDRKNAELMLQNYNQQLSTEVNNKTLELINKNNSLEQLLKNLQSTQALLIQSEKMASLGLLTAGIAHEINNPINFITANIKPLRRDILSLKEFLDVLETFELITDPKKLKEVKKIKTELEIDYSLEEIDLLLNGIEEGAARTFEIIKGLTNFSRVDETDLKMDNINQSINTTLMLLQNTFGERIEIIKDYGDLPLVECYPSKLNQVFMNIIANAVQSIADTGAIAIKTWIDEKKSLLRISIKDTGRGMRDSVMAKIFEPFYTNKEIGEGTGLGLFISFGIVENHRGRIEVKSEEGIGSEFVIVIPLTQLSSDIKN